MLEARGAAVDTLPVLAHTLTIMQVECLSPHMRQRKPLRVEWLGQGPGQQYQRINQRETGERGTKEGEGPTKVPGNWGPFPRGPKNKENSLVYQRRCIHYLFPGGNRSLQHRSLCAAVALTPDAACDHEKADTKILVHYKMPQRVGHPCFGSTVVLTFCIHRENTLLASKYHRRIWAPSAWQELPFSTHNAIVVLWAKRSHSATRVPQLYRVIRFFFFWKGKKNRLGSMGAYTQVKAFNLS
ncbi:hypothetical protein GWK47_028006 [Chionoecetes opilio]|uniref:Uncharacterized protein n=1 Tax=Chionoecetes opilio TaxID=41210 RepID=A0A8J4Z573_CHIOP|nr:hypothetical protein GWK47_028006 [Chionoecetes opilio]